MRTALDRFRAVYGSSPLHLLTLIAGFALFDYVLATITPSTLWNPNTWWQSILVWFAAIATAGVAEILRWSTGSWSQAVDYGRALRRRFRCSTMCGSPQWGQR